MATITLSKEQQAARLAVKDWMASDRWSMTIGGLAGTGKTTLVTHLLEDLQRYQPSVCAYTGKAVNVLRQKNCPQAETIHSTIYAPEVELIPDEEGAAVIDGERYRREVSFNVRAEPGSIRLMVVDEASMVSQEIYEDLQDVCQKVLFVGDHGQLLPIGTDISLMSNPDVCLEEIHRQVRGNPIIAFAHEIRRGVAPAAAVSSVGVQPVSEYWRGKKFADVDVTIVGTNRTRQRVNRAARLHFFGSDVPKTPVVGDRVICLRNNRQLGLHNGMTGIVSKSEMVTPARNTGVQLCRITFFDGERDRIIDTNPNQYGAASTMQLRGFGELFDYAYGKTAHKSQGSEYESVAVIDESGVFLKHNPDFDRSRWLYTAATRAKELLDVYV